MNFTFHPIWDNPSHWLIYIYICFKLVKSPPTRQDYACSMVIFFSRFRVPQNGTDPRDPRCIADFAGGECADPNGSHSCTYHIEDTGPSRPSRPSPTEGLVVGWLWDLDKVGKKKSVKCCGILFSKCLAMDWIYIYITDLSGIDFEWIEIGSVTLDELSGRDNSWLGRANAKPWKSCVSCISH